MTHIDAEHEEIEFGAVKVLRRAGSLTSSSIPEVDRAGESTPQIGPRKAAALPVVVEAVPSPVRPGTPGLPAVNSAVPPAVSFNPSQRPRASLNGIGATTEKLSNLHI